MIVYFCLVYELVANIFQNHERVCEGGESGFYESIICVRME